MAKIVYGAVFWPEVELCAMDRTSSILVLFFSNHILSSLGEDDDAVSSTGNIIFAQQLRAGQVYTLVFSGVVDTIVVDYSIYIYPTRVLSVSPDGYKQPDHLDIGAGIAVLPCQQTNDLTNQGWSLYTFQTIHDNVFIQSPNTNTPIFLNAFLYKVFTPHIAYYYFQSYAMIGANFGNGNTSSMSNRNNVTYIPYLSSFQRIQPR